MHLLRLTLKRIIRPDTLERQALDDYLEKGYYRIGQTMMTCRLINLEGALRSTIWTRVPLQGHTFRKGLRKRLRKVERELVVDVHPAVHDDEHEAVYTRYIEARGGVRSPSLVHFRYGDREDVDLFDTWEVSVRTPDGELAAFSWFDRGETTIQSLLCAYAPEFGRFGMGVYSMLAEMRYGIDNGYAHFYAGYVVPGCSTMDYKLVPDDVWFLDDTLGRWRKWQERNRYVDAKQRAMLRLAVVQAQVHQSTNLRTRVLFNRGFGLGEAFPSCRGALDHAILLQVAPTDGEAQDDFITWDFHTAQYAMIRCSRQEFNVPFLEGGMKPVQLLTIQEDWGRSTNPRYAATTLQAMAGSPQRRAE